LADPNAPPIVVTGSVQAQSKTHPLRFTSPTSATATQLPVLAHVLLPPVTEGEAMITRRDLMIVEPPSL
jgi:hypothetical protein